MKNTGRPTLDEYSQLKIWTAASVPVRLPMSAIGQKRTKVAGALRSPYATWSHIINLYQGSDLSA